MLHGMTAGGLKSLDNIFSGRYSTALTAAGAPMLDLFYNARLVHPQYGCWIGTNATAQPQKVAFCTRHLFESTARQLVAGNARVELVYAAKVTGLQFEDATSAAGGAAAAAGSGPAPQKAVTGAES
jgi:hypothetical protein